MDHWYVLYTKPRGEFRVQEALAAHATTVFLPTVLDRRPGKAPQRRPFFPRYLFAQLDLAQLNPDLLRWTPGLLILLSFGGIPAQIPEEAVALIQERVEELNGQGGLPTHDFQRGERVRIRSGPLQGLEAVFDGPLTPSERVRVLVDFLSGINRVELPVDHLEAAGPEVPRKRERRTRGRGRWIRGKEGRSDPKP